MAKRRPSLVDHPLHSTTASKRPRPDFAHPPPAVSKSRNESESENKSEGEDKSESESENKSESESENKSENKRENKRENMSKPATVFPACTTLHVVTGSYERVLHGFAADLPTPNHPHLAFTDTFLFHAHASSISCLAISPPSHAASNVILATGSTDERINLYSLSTAPPRTSQHKPQLPSLHGGSIAENPQNKELGCLLHHASSITALHFPTRSKLLSAAQDSTIAITRTRDWTALSTIKAPIPKPQGRPSGDTVGPGGVPAGINDFAVHPSMKLMISVGKGEKCMRLWNLVTGKKAGVLNWDRAMLAAVGEGRFDSGEARRVIWDREGNDFVVGFERSLVVFTIDCKPKGKIIPMPRTKLHQMHYLPSTSQAAMLLVSTEDGRVLVYDTATYTTTTTTANATKDGIPSCRLVAQIGGPAAAITSRVKDFEIVSISASTFIIVAGSSDGTVRFWRLEEKQLATKKAEVGKAADFTALQAGELLGSYSTGTRITCLKAFAMNGKRDADKDDGGDDDEPVVEEEGIDGSEDEDEEDEEDE